MSKFVLKENKIVKVLESESNEVWLKKLKVGDKVTIEKVTNSVIATAVGEIIKMNKNDDWYMFEIEWEIGSRKYKEFFNSKGVKPIDERKSWVMAPLNESK